MKPRIIAIIPARGGSKGIPKKNIKPLCGKPLIAYTIEAALGSKFIDRVVVSTEDEEIAEISKKYGAEVVKRPEELARDDSPTIDAIMHVINWFQDKGEHFDIVVLLESTSPLRKENDIDNAMKLFIENLDKADSLVGAGGVHSDTEHPYGIKKIEDGYIKPFIETGITFYQRQQLPEVYSIYGGIYVSKVDTLKKYKTFYQDRTIPYFVERWQNYEIDDIYDFICVESILKHRVRGKQMTRKALSGPSLLIEGNRIFLRSLREKDVTKKYCKWLNDKEVNKYLAAGNKKNTVKSLLNYVKEKAKKKDCIFLGIIDKETNDYIGNVKLEPIDFYYRKATVGIMIGDKNYWGKGYGTESMNLIVDYCFSDLDLNKVTLGVDTKNMAAIKVYRKVGFKQEGVLKEDSIRHGKKYDSSVMSILKTDYLKSGGFG